MRTIALSGDEISVLTAMLHGTSGVLSTRSRETHRDFLGLEIAIVQTSTGIQIHRFGHWKIGEITRGSSYYRESVNLFEFDGDEEEFRRDLVLTKVIIR